MYYSSCSIKMGREANILYIVISLLVELTQNLRSAEQTRFHTWGKAAKIKT